MVQSVIVALIFIPTLFHGPVILRAVTCDIRTWVATHRCIGSTAKLRQLLETLAFTSDEFRSNGNARNVTESLIVIKAYVFLRCRLTR